ncbi:hypothetical protein N7486_004196 [Penicillium sp. IBT 16267x]|nr:hypothetical protein N7486_004196 [Penicillium sp. IBT 16267x]
MATASKPLIPITGANQGLGFATAQQLASTGQYNILVAARSAEKAEGAVKQLQESSNNGSLTPLRRNSRTMRSPYLVFLPWLTVACLDGTYLSSALTKVPQGAWFTITLAAILAMLFLLWRYGKEQQWFAETEDRFPTSHFIVSSPDGQMSLSKQYGDLPVSVSRGLGIFFDKAGEMTPIVFSQFVLKLTSLPEVIMFFHLRPIEQPSIAAENRFTVSRLAIPNCYRLVVRYGYNDEIIAPNMASVIIDQVRKYLMSRRASVPLGEEDEEKDSVTPDS